MKANYTIANNVSHGNYFFYLMNWKPMKQIELVGFWNNQDSFYKPIKYCVGVWKVKVLKF